MSDEDLEKTYLGIIKDSLSLYTAAYPEEFSSVTFKLDSEKTLEYMLDVALHCFHEQEFLLGRNVLDVLRYFNGKHSIIPEKNLEAEIKGITTSIIAAMLTKVKDEYKAGNAEAVSNDISVVLRFNEKHGITEETRLYRILGKMRNKYRKD